MKNPDPTDARLTEVPITRGGRLGFAALVAAAVIVAIATASMPMAVAVLAVGGPILGVALLLRARRDREGH